MRKLIILIAAILLMGLAVADDAATTAPIPSTPYYYQNPTANPGASWQTDYCNNTGMDFLVVLEPDACSPAPVRSDLLEEQEVPVMCRLTGIKINPLIQVPYIKTIVVGIENKSSEVSYVSFYPARTALTQSYLLSQPSSGFEGSPTMNNLGYLWIQLARQPVESKMPEKVTVNANAIITYDIGRTYGINENQFVLPLLSQEEWLHDYKYYNFWKGKGYVRLINITGKSSARIAVYSSANAIPQMEELRVGQTSGEMLLPGFYCGAGVQVRLDSIDTPKNRARLIVNGNEELVASGEYISDSDCQVGAITPSPGYGGTVAIRCRTGGFSDLTIKDFGAALEIEDYTEDAGKLSQREQDVTIGNQILLQNLGQKKPYYLYVGFIGKQLDSKEGIIGSVITFERAGGSQIKNKDEVSKVVSLIHDYMEAQRGDALLVMQQPESQLNSKLEEYFELRGIKNAKEKYNFRIWKEGAKESDVFESGLSIEIVEVEGPQQVTYKDPAIEAAYKEAMDKWKAIAHEYSTKPSPEGMWYGVMALKQAADLASYFQKQLDKAEILKELIDKYSQASEPEIVEQVEWAREELRRTIASGSGNRHATFSTSSGSYSVELIGIEKTGDMEYSVLEVERTVDGRKDVTTGQYSLNDEIDGWEIIDITDASIRLQNITNRTNERTVSKGAWARIDDTKITVADIVRKMQAKVTVLPLETNRTTEANFTIQIGIEKRSIKLSPEQTRDLIKKLDDTVEKLGNINRNLGNVVSWWKKACYAGAATLWVKNFLTGLSGEATARKMVMETWGEKCADEQFRKQVQESKGIKPGIGRTVISESQCFRSMEDEIDKDIDTMKAALDESNKFVEKVKSKEGVVRNCGLFGLLKCIDDEKFIAEAQNQLNCAAAKTSEECNTKTYCSWTENECVGTEIKDPVSGKTVESSVVFGELKELNNKGWLFKDDVKDIYLNLALYKECESKESKFSSSICTSVVKSTYAELSSYEKIVAESKIVDQSMNVFGEAIPYTKGKLTPPAKIITLNEKAYPLGKWFGDDTALEKKLVGEGYKDQKAALFGFEGIYWIAVVEPTSENYYRINKKKIIPLILSDDGKSYEEMTEDEKKKYEETFKSMASISEVQEVNFGACEGNTIIRGPEAGEAKNTIKFWENYPHQGVAYMPLGDGWYFATTPESWKENGDLEEAIICNVGPDGIPNFDFSTGTGLGDDAQCCTRFKTGVGVPAVVEKQYERVLQCVPEAMRKFKAGDREIKISGCLKNYKLGKAPVARPAVECEDFMSPSDCNLMYNLCDPVMCPSSRCDFAGRIPVDNVKQSGVIGSIMLCLPNFEGGSGVLVPICLDGVHAGIENWISVLNSTRKCLNEQLTSGKTVGICDQIMSFYMCDLFWKELDPFLKTGIPAMTESLTSRGGGEYAFFSDSWKHSVSAMQYFTDSYGLQTFKAFEARSTKEVETEVCKKFIGIKYPGQAKFWDELSKPESPPQSWASFQEIALGGPSPDSHYKVYYHVYAGADQGVYYRIWLKRTQTAGFSAPQTEYIVPYAFGYLAAGESADETKDFQAPSGYTQICISINEKEQCGYLQTGTEFALTELQNYYLENQVEQDIKTAKECSEGKATVFPTPEITTNIQSAVEYALDPQIYRRGIVRVCSGQNPGGGVESSNWKQVGYCDNKEIGCYLYLPSLNDSITDLGIVKDLYTYAENEDISNKVNELGLDPRETSQEYIDLYEPSVSKLADDIEDIIEAYRGVETFDKDDYYKEIGYSLKEDSEEWLESTWGRTAKFIETVTRVRDKCAHPDEKVRADWMLGRLLELKAKLLALPDVFEAEKITKEEKKKIDVKFPEVVEGQECRKLNGEIVEDSICNEKDTLTVFPILSENFVKIDRFNHPYFGSYISIYYPQRYKSIHRGIDIYTITDGAPISAIAAGEVLDDEGECISIYHPGIEYTSVYCHVNNIQVKKGDDVKIGQEIAKVYYPAAPHLHLTIYRGKISEIPAFASTFAECGCYSDEECDASPKLGCQLLKSDEYLIDPIDLIGNSPHNVCCKMGEKEKLDCSSFKGVSTCEEGHFGQCWWDALGSIGSQCKDCPQLHDGDCEGAKSWALDLFEPNILFKWEEDCEDNNCGLDCLWVGKPARTEPQKCYNIDIISLKNKLEEINAATIEKGKEQNRIDELNKLVLLTKKHKNELDKIFDETGKVIYDADILLSDLTIQIVALQNYIEEVKLGQKLTLNEIKEVEAAYRAYVPTAVQKIISSGTQYDCADFAATILEDFAKNYITSNGKKLKLILYNDDGVVTENYCPKISAKHLALYNTKKVSGKPNVGDLLIYEWEDGRWHTILIFRKELIASGQTYSYKIAAGNLDEELPTQVSLVDTTGIASENPYAGIDYDHYLKWFTSDGERGKYLYENSPRQWDFEKILRIQPLT